MKIKSAKNLLNSIFNKFISNDIEVSLLDLISDVKIKISLKHLTKDYKLKHFFTVVGNSLLTKYNRQDEHLFLDFQSNEFYFFNDDKIITKMISYHEVELQMLITLEYLQRLHKHILKENYEIKI